MSLFDINQRSRPILKWAGGKSGLLEQMVQYFPTTCKRYIEPFFGGGAVFLALRPDASPSILNDVNSELVNLYQAVRDRPEELMKALDSLTERYSEAFYYQLRSENPSSAIEQAARTVFLNKTGFNGLYRQNSKGGFNVPFGKRVTCPALYGRENLLEVTNRFRSTTLLCDDFEVVLNQAGDGDFVYCDPPYEPLSVTSSFNAYNRGGFGQAEQARLRDACARAAGRGAFVVVSNSTAPLILNLYQDWDVRQVMARRAINSKGSSRGEIAEVLVILSGDAQRRRDGASHEKNAL